MRTRAARAVMACLTAFALVRLGGGCIVDSASDCSANGTCADTGTTTTTTTGTDSTTTVPPACIDFASGDAVSPSCGVFVAPGKGSDDTGDGSQQTPFATIGKALAAAADKPVYVCAGALTEAVVVQGEATIVGGFECDGWTYTAEKPALTAPADGVAITLDDGASLDARDLALASPNASKKGASSIAVLVKSGADLSLARVDVTAGDGAPGADGATPDAVGPNGEGKDGDQGMPGVAGCNLPDAQLFGGLGGVTMCGGVSTGGGSGGNGTKTVGADGSEGEPTGGTGIGGSGQKAATNCKPGGPGSEGAIGPAGAGAKGSGALTSDGFTGAAGEPGSAGTPGQGGGGGGGGKACANGMAGPSGGGGGAGGCGGAGGGAGTAGGSSIAIAAFQAKSIVVSGGVIKTGKGGIGGAGAAGQSGGYGGPLGNLGGLGACAGGQGGGGGAGGPGGGGAGGHSIGIAWTQTAPMVDAATYAHGAPGSGGAGGPGNEAPGTGDAGLSQDTLELN